VQYLDRREKTMQVFVSLAAIVSLFGLDATLVPRTYPARDSVAVPQDSQPDSQSLLDSLAWKAGEFEVTCQPQESSLTPALVRFPSAVPSGNAINDLVALEWFAACDADGRVIRAPAIIVVHESGARMTVGRLFARSLRAYGIHAFLLHLPYYGERRAPGVRPDAVDFMLTVRQAVSDVRRARDAVAALPKVEPRRIGLQGTSLGGFVSTFAAGLDGGFAATFIMLAGGDLEDILSHGDQDTAKIRAELTKAGYTGEKLKRLVWQVEPTRLAHRLDAHRTWLYSAEEDRVVPIKNALALAQAASLAEDHHVRMPGDHYSAIIHFPTILKHVTDRLREVPETTGPGATPP
jgi:dienelactone hydrolase